MKKSLPFLLAALGLSVLPAQAALLFSDNFNAADNPNFDSSSTTALADGRLSGSLNSAIQLRSWGAQEQISNNQLFLPTAGNNGVRFENAAGPFGGTNRFNWAAGATGTSIITSGGFIVSFDWIPIDNTNTNWISYQVGTINGDSGNLTDDDYGILFRQNGNTERFDNTVNLGAGGAFAATAGGVARRVEITYMMGSFADGANVTATSRVNGVQVASDTFTWDSNGGAIYMELGHNEAGNRVDNLSVSTIPEPSMVALFGLSALGFAARRRR